MRIIIAGSRTVTENDVIKALRCCSWIGFTTAVVSGTAIGADFYGEKWAENHHIDIHKFPADWKKYGKRAGYIRNKMMAENAEGLIAIWDGKSQGTYNMIELANQYNLRIAILHIDTDSYEEFLPKGPPLADIWEIAEERASVKEYEAHLPRLQAEKEAGSESRKLIQKITGNPAG